jgi:biotin synthase-like enzyme
MKDPDRFDIRDRETGDFLLGGVKLVPAIMHGPDMAFLNLDPTCPLGCLFCTAGEERSLDWPPERWVKVVLEANAKALERRGRPLGSVAITAGMPDGPERMLERMVEVVEGVRKGLPEVPIGVEPNAVPREGLERLKAAGADELKVNVQAANPVIFRKVCPGLDWDDIIRCLKEGVEVFGRNKVSSNIIIGLGENEDDIVRTLLALARMGVAANIRVLRINHVNREALEKALGQDIGIKEPERILRLIEAQRIIFEDNGLDPGEFRTMCHRCGCCDLTLKDM